ncbi:DUF4349 domain-containing protein [Foetidibacter luteolus]|uniref:DUF4349 domain-containing protein n=1 Tax=Foetidibacter luteolus TaxID=2608880 RepID=UPI00129A24A6|nr:DUF4349 domain-containing protein [Foetidibacter luteolus]
MKQLMLAVYTALLLISCRPGNEKEAVQLVNDVEMADAKPEEKSASFNAGLMATDTTTVAAPAPVLQAGQPVKPDWDKKIIKTAKVTLELEDYNAFNAVMHGRLKSYGAYIAQENQQENDYRIQNDLVIKVPVDQFDNLVNTLGGEGIKLLEKNISSDDVTGEVVDTRARIEAKKQVRARYLELLKQAKNMEEILQVQNEINEIQENLEAASGRVEYLTHAAAYSTINLSYYQYINGGSEKDSQPGFAKQIGEAFKTGASVLVNLVLFAISVWPFMLAGVILYFYFRRWRSRGTVRAK